MGHRGWVSDFDFDAFYDAYPRVERAFQASLDESLEPRGPDSLYTLVDDLGLPRDARALDVGCGEGGHAVELARRFGCSRIISDQDHLDVLAEEQPTLDRIALNDRVERGQRRNARAAGEHGLPDVF